MPVHLKRPGLSLKNRPKYKECPIQPVYVTIDYKVLAPGEILLRKHLSILNDFSERGSQRAPFFFAQTQAVFQIPSKMRLLALLRGDNQKHDPCIVFLILAILGAFKRILEGKKMVT